ncbi:MFS transporter [Kitasatospora sp. NPDC058170]|uniref:MFS transporter n=1 Tax=Kitasatospora sp. NPDC058170 TaxID=3346364 RepID=UPI0036DD684D
MPETVTAATAETLTATAATTPLLRRPDFARLWTAQTASLFATQIGDLALPLTAVLALAADSGQVGLLASVARLPYLLLALVAGVLADRLRRRRLMAAADIGRAAVLAAVPLLHWADELGIGTLYAAAFLTGCGTVLFDVAAQAYLPRLLHRDDLAAGNALLGSSQSAATIGGPALGGLLVQWLTAPVAVCAAALSYAGSVVSLLLIRDREERRPVPTGKPLQEIREGLRLLVRSERLRTMTVMAAVFNLSFTAFEVAYLQFLPRTLGLSPGAIGLVLAALGPGFLLGAVLAARLPGRLGYGRALLLTAAVANLVMPLTALVHGGGPLAVAALMLVNLLFAAFGTANNVAMLTIRQSITPDGLQGRVAATNRFVAMGVAPLGALLGGWLGASLGLRGTVLVTALGLCLALVPLGLSSLAWLGRELPSAA